MLLSQCDAAREESVKTWSESTVLFGFFRMAGGELCGIMWVSVKRHTAARVRHVWVLCSSLQRLACLLVAIKVRSVPCLVYCESRCGAYVRQKCVSERQ